MRFSSLSSLRTTGLGSPNCPLPSTNPNPRTFFDNRPCPSSSLPPSLPIANLYDRTVTNPTSPSPGTTTTTTTTTHPAHHGDPHQPLNLHPTSAIPPPPPQDLSGALPPPIHPPPRRGPRSEQGPHLLPARDPQPVPPAEAPCDRQMARPKILPAQTG